MVCRKTPLTISIVRICMFPFKPLVGGLKQDKPFTTCIPATTAPDQNCHDKMFTNLQRPICHVKRRHGFFLSRTFFLADVRGRARQPVYLKSSSLKRACAVVVALCCQHCWGDKGMRTEHNRITQEIQTNHGATQPHVLPTSARLQLVPNLADPSSSTCVDIGSTCTILNVLSHCTTVFCSLRWVYLSYCV